VVEYIKVKNPRGPGFWLLDRKDFRPDKFELYVEPLPEVEVVSGTSATEVTVAEPIVSTSLGSTTEHEPPPAPKNDITAYDVPITPRKRGR